MLKGCDYKHATVVGVSTTVDVWEPALSPEFKLEQQREIKEQERVDVYFQHSLI